VLGAQCSGLGGRDRHSFLIPHSSFLVGELSRLADVLLGDEPETNGKLQLGLDSRASR